MSAAGNSVRSLATESYNAAAKRFVTRDFDECWALLRPLAEKCLALTAKGEISPNTRSKLWVLYAALADTSSKLAIPLSWETVRKGYERYEEIEPSVMLAVAQVLLKDLDNIKATAGAIEEYISLHPALNESHRPLVALLVTEILPSLGDYEYARGFTDDCSIFDASTKTQIKERLLSREQAAKEAREHEEKQRLELEQQREAAAAAAAAAAATSTTALDTTNDEQKVAKVPKKTQIKRQPVKAHSSLPQLWKAWVLNTVRSRGFTNGILVVIFFLTLASNLRVRRRLQASTKWIWAGAKQAALMATTVTYF